MPWLSNRNDGLKSPRLRGELAPLCNGAANLHYTKRKDLLPS